MWFLGCRQVIRYDGQSWKSYDNLRGTQQIFTLADGTLIFEMKNNLVHFDGSRFETVLLPGQPYGYAIYGVPHLSSSGDLWFQIEDAYGYPGSINVIHDGEVHQLPPLDRGPAPDPALISPIAMFPGGMVFYASSSNVVYLYDGQSWKTLGTTSDPWSDIISSQLIGFAPDGALWVNNKNELERFDGKRLVSPFQGQISPDEDSQCSQNYNFIIDSKGSIWSWVPNSPLVCYFDSMTNRVSPYTLFFNVSQLVADNDGGVWAASNAGFVANLTPDILESRNYRKINLIRIGGDTIHSTVNPDRIIVSSDGSIWVLAKNSGLYRYDGKNWKFIQQKSLQAANDLAIGENGVIWVLCNSPEKYDSESLPSAYFHDCGLSQDLTIMQDGTVAWFIYDVNSRFDGLYGFDGTRWTQYTKYQIGNFTPNKMLVAPDGALWLIGRNIWARYKP